MTNILISGATGNVGIAVIEALSKLTHVHKLYAGVRNVAASRELLSCFPIQLLEFDFANSNSFHQALAGCDIFFLLRPPALSSVTKYFEPLLKCCVESGVKHIVFLSVQGVEKSSIIPHHKIEKLIVASNIPYTFLRPAYFMQNFTTVLSNELVLKKRIYLPAGDARFTLVDVRDVGAVAAAILTDTAHHVNTAYELTSKDKLSFYQIAAVMSEQLGVAIKFISPNLLSFFYTKRKEKIPTPLIFVMIMLHYLPRFQKEPAITDWVEKLTGLPAIPFVQFIQDNKNKLMPAQK